MSAALQSTAAMGDRLFEEMWHTALTAYQTESKRELHFSKLQKLRTTDDVLAEIESRGNRFANFRGKHGPLWARIHAVLHPVAIIANIAQTTAGGGVPFGAPALAVLGAALHLIRTGDEVKQGYDWIGALFEEFGAIVARLAEYRQLRLRDMNPVMQRHLGAILICMLRLFGGAGALIMKGRFRQYLKCAFLGTDDKAKSLMGDLDRHLKNEQSIINSMTYIVSSNTEQSAAAAADNTWNIIAGQAQMQSMLETQGKSSGDETKVKEMRATLTTPATLEVHRLFSSQSRELVKGTGTWLAKELLFQACLNGKIPVLGVFGGPGCGKTHLATWTILHLREHFGTPNTGVSFAYFFVKDHDVALHNPNNILKSLALQIADAEPTFRDHAIVRCSQPIATATDDDTWENLFLAYISGPATAGHRIIFVIDGLDEAPLTTQQKFLSLIKDWAHTASTIGASVEYRMQFLIFGRPELKASVDLLRQGTHIDVSAAKSRNDVEMFVRSSLPQLQLMQELESRGVAGHSMAVKFGQAVVSKVLQVADGVFLWAKLLMLEMEDLNQAQIGEVLKSPPQSLDETIDKLLRRIARLTKVDNEQAGRMLTLICFARRPLRFGELKAFLSLPNGRPDELLWRRINGLFASLFEFETQLQDDNDDRWLGREDDESEDGNDDRLTGEGLSQVNISLPELALSTVQSQKTGSCSRVECEYGNVEDVGDDNCNLDLTTDEIENSIEDESLQPFASGKASEYNTKAFHDPKQQLQTSIRYSHQRFKEFLLAHGKRAAGKSRSRAMRVDADRGEAQMTIECLQALTQVRNVDRHTASLNEYAMEYFYHHLEWKGSTWRTWRR